MLSFSIFNNLLVIENRLKYNKTANFYQTFIIVIFAASEENIRRYSVIKTKFISMRKIIVLLVFVSLFVNFSCGTSETGKEVKIKIETEYGTIKLKLYDETPLHRDNFIKLIKDGVYTDLLFHRIIQGFMIQGGDPQSKNAAPGAQLGSGDLGYTIPAEINPKFFHRRGVLAAARQGDNINPEKRSSASQFYIMQGRVFRPEELDTLQITLEEKRKMNLFQAKLKIVEPELTKLGTEGKQDELMARYNALKEEVISEISKLPPVRFTEEQRKAYTSVGGYPSLDNNYTIFGEVTEGMGIVDQIASQPRDKSDRPLKDIKFTISLIN
jgi:cyclophilin family peptidyl-prolyl cis-trans isomerase